MKEVLGQYKDIVIQIATPYSTGTGFYLDQYQLIITNEHVVRNNKIVVVHGECLPKQLTKIIFVDQKYDLAFLEVPENISCRSSILAKDDVLKEGDPVVAIGHPYGLKFTATQGIVSSTFYRSGDIQYIQHDAALNPGNSGGPLINKSGEIVGVNTFIIRDGQNIGFSLPINLLKESIEAFLANKGNEGVRCHSCSFVVTNHNIEDCYCPRCGTKITLPSQLEDYEPIGIAATIEAMLKDLNFDVNLSRRGPNNWEIIKGSAGITISYHEKSGLIIGDAYLCHLPKENIKPVYQFLLQENYKIEGLSFSVRGNDIILSLLIFDQYLIKDSALHLFSYLFEKADEYDNILVEQYGASWREESN